MPEPFAAWLQRFEAEFQRRSGLPWREIAGDLDLLLDCHTVGLSPEDAATDQLDWLGLKDRIGPWTPSSDPVGDPSLRLRFPTLSIVPPSTVGVFPAVLVLFSNPRSLTACAPH